MKFVPSIDQPFMKLMETPPTGTPFGSVVLPVSRAMGSTMSFVVFPDTTRFGKIEFALMFPLIPGKARPTWPMLDTSTR